MAKRKPRAGEVVCRCGAYPFPHRQFGGLCTSTVLFDTWRDRQYDSCRACPMYETSDDGMPECAVENGRETWHEAPCVMDHVRYEGIKLYGVNRPTEKKMGWRR